MLEFYGCGGAAHQPKHTQLCQCVRGQPWVYHGVLEIQMQPLNCSANLVEPALGAAAAGLYRWFLGVEVLRLLWGFPEEEEAILNYSAQSPASV